MDPHPMATGAILRGMDVIRTRKVAMISDHSFIAAVVSMTSPRSRSSCSSLMSAWAFVSLVRSAWYVSSPPSTAAR